MRKFTATTTPYLSWVIAVSILMVGVINIFGWIYNTPSMIQIIPYGSLMNPLTTICFILISCGVLFLTYKKDNLLFIVGILLVIITLIRIVGILNIVPFDIDLLLFKERLASYQSIARMSAYTTNGFLLLGVSFISARWKKTSAKLQISEMTSLTITLFSCFGILGFIFNLDSIIKAPFFFSASVITVILFLIGGIITFLLVYKESLATLAPRSRYLVKSVLVIGIIFTVIITTIIEKVVIVNMERDFYEHVAILSDQIQDRFEIYIAVLQGGKGLFASSNEVTRQEWRKYVESIELQKNYPGIQGFGYSIFIQPESREEHEQSIQAEGFPEYHVRPTGLRDIYTSIIYLEPFDIRNRQAFGYDMFSNKIRREAMERARDTGSPQMSGRITLVQEIDEDVQPGFLIYVPVYENTAILETVADRKEHIIGYVYSPFRARNFIEGILSPQDLKYLDVEISIGTSEDESHILYKSYTTDHFDNVYTLTKNTHLDIAGQDITLSFVTNPLLYTKNNIVHVLPIFLVFIGIVISILGTLVLYTLLSTREEAEVYAEKLTLKLKQKVREIQNTLHENTRITEMFENAFDYSPIGIALVSPDGRWLRVNKKITQILGYTEHELLDLTFQDITHPEDLAEDVALVQQVLDNNIAAYEIQKRYLHKNGHTIWAQLNVSLVRNDDTQKTPRFFISQIKDITEERRIDEAKNDFVSLASHQMRTPLSSINWYVEMLLDHQEDFDEKQLKQLKHIAEGSERMVELIDNLLNISRIELGTLVITEQATDLATLIEEVLQNYERKRAEKNITITQTTTGTVQLVQTDPRILSIIFDNLISNAIKYSHPESTVTITTTYTPDHVNLSFRDQGYGIPKKEQSRIFTKMYRAENIRLKESEGFGLGLYLTKNLIEQLGGIIGFTSQENQGTEFTVTLSLRKT